VILEHDRHGSCGFSIASGKRSVGGFVDCVGFVGEKPGGVVVWFFLLDGWRQRRVERWMVWRTRSGFGSLSILS